MGKVKEYLKYYNPKILFKGLETLEKGKVKDRLLMNLFLSNASVAYSPIVTASVGIAFGKELGTSIIAIIAFGYQIGKLFLPLFGKMKMSKLMKLLMVGDITSILVILLTLITGSKALLVIGLDLVSIVTIAMVLAFQNHLKRWMNRTSKRRKLVKAYDYIFNGMDVLLKFIVSTIVALSAYFYADFGLVIAIVLICCSIYFQLKFRKEVELGEIEDKKKGE